MSEPVTSWWGVASAGFNRIDFREEYGIHETAECEVVEVLDVLPSGSDSPDMAFMKTSRQSTDGAQLPRPVRLETAEPTER